MRDTAELERAMSGVRIGNYEIISTLGRGSIGVVYKARDSRLGRIVAIKALKSVFLDTSAPDSVELKRFYQESQSASKLRHPNIVTIFDVGCTELGSPYIVMDYIEGKTLSDIIDSSAPLDPNTVLQFLYPIASAVDYAHAQGILHRDITPNNIIIDNSERPFLLDFSLAKLVNSSLTPTGALIGSPGYMAPELVDGVKPSEAVDIFSIGVVAFELFTGQPPFIGDDIVRIVFSVVHEAPQSFAHLGVQLPASLEKVIGKALAKNPAERWGSALAFVDAIRDALTHSGITITVPGAISGDSGTYASLKSERTTATNVQRLPSYNEPAPSFATTQTRPTVRAVEPSVQPSDNMLTTSFRGEFDFRSEALSDLDDELNLNRMRVVGGNRSLYIFVLLVGLCCIPLYIYFPHLQNFFEKRIINLGDNIADSKSAGVYGSGELPRQSIDTARFVNASNKKLHALLRAGTDTNGKADITRLCSAVYESGRREDSSLTNLLRKLAEHADESVRIEALRSLQIPYHAKQVGVIDTFIGRLSDRDYLIRGLAIKALAEHGDRYALEALRRRYDLEDNEKVKMVLEDATKRLAARLPKS